MEPPLLGDAGSTTGQFRHYGFSGNACDQHMAMVTIAGNDRIGRSQSGLNAHHNCLLADVEVAEAADHAHAVKLPGPLLEAPYQQHLAVEFQQFRPCRLVPFWFRRPGPSP
jgi:hypothetical protein